MKMIESFKGGNKVAEIDITGWQIPEVVALAKSQIEIGRTMKVADVITMAEAEKEMPALIGGIDYWYHKTPADLGWLVLLQLDLYFEGEDSEIKTKGDLKRCQRYLTWLRKAGVDVPI